MQVGDVKVHSAGLDRDAEVGLLTATNHTTALARSGLVFRGILPWCLV